MTRTASAERIPEFGATTMLLWTGLLAAEVAAVGTYFATTSAAVDQIQYLVYPFVWINAGMWAVANTRPMPGNRRHRLLGLIVAGGYLLLVLVVSGKVGPGVPGTPFDLRIAWYAPGWGPLVAAEGSWVRLYLVPFEVLGYTSLAYLMYANTLALSRGTLAGALGLLTCVGCTVPVLVPAVGLLGGPATGLSTTAYRWSYDLGTLLYLVTLGVLYVGYRRFER